MSIKRVFLFLMALVITLTGGAAPVLGTTDAEPIMATERTYRFDNDRLLLGAYCFPKDEYYYTLREWFIEAGLQFYVGAWGQQLTTEDLDWMQENGQGVIAPNSDYYVNMSHDAIWGVDCRDEPSSSDFEYLAQMVKERYEQDPERFPMINLLPMYASAEQLGEVVDFPGAGGYEIDAFSIDSIQYRMHVNDYVGAIDSDIISVDIYPLSVNGEGEKGTYAFWLRNLDILSVAARATGRDLWVITQAAGNCIEQGGSHRYCDTPEDQRWQNYVSLAFGAKAIIYGCFYTGWFDQASHMIDNSGNRTDTYYAVKQVNEEMAALAEEYGKYENHGTVLYNGINLDSAGSELALAKVEKKYRPVTFTAAPLLCGCFTEKEGDGKAYVFTNMYQPECGKEASFTAIFPGAERITVYRKGEVRTYYGGTLDLTLENSEGVFVTVK